MKKQIKRELFNSLTHTHTFSLNQYKKIITGAVCKIEYNVNKKVGLLNLSRSIFGV